MGNPVLLFDSILIPGNIITTDMLPWGCHNYATMNWEGSYTADAMINGRLYDRWEAVTVSPQEIHIDCGYESDIDAIGIAGHNLKSAACAITVHASNTPFFVSGGSITTVLASFYASSNRAILKIFSTIRRRYWRISFGAAISPVHIGCLMLGRRMELPYPPDTPYTPRAYSQAAEVLYSKSGQPLGALRTNPTIKTTVQISTIDRDWALQGWGQFTWSGILWADYGWVEWLREELLSLSHMLYAWDYATYPEDVVFGMYDGDGDLAAPVTVLRFIDSFTFALFSNKEV